MEIPNKFGKPPIDSGIEEPYKRANGYFQEDINENIDLFIIVITSTKKKW